MSTADEYVKCSNALAWARAEVQQVVDRLHGFAQAATPDDAVKYRALAAMLTVELIGAGGPIIGAFDARRPAIEQSLVGA